MDQETKRKMYLAMLYDMGIEPSDEPLQQSDLEDETQEFFDVEEYYEELYGKEELEKFKSKFE